MDPGLNAFDRMNRGLLTAAGMAECVAESSVGPQVYFAGGTGVPLVLLHGAGHHAGAWSGVVAPLLTAGRYRVIAVDLAGHGASAPGEGRLSMEMFLAGIEAVPLDGPAILVGNSLGAWLSTVIALQHPERVSRVVAVNGGPITGLRADLTLTPKDREEARRIWEAALDRSHWGVADFVLDEMIRKGRDGALGRVTIDELQDHLMDGRLGEIATPVDLVWGESDGVVPLEYGRMLEAQLPNTRLTVIPQCGHVPQVECAERFVSALLGVLAADPPSGHAT